MAALKGDLSSMVDIDERCLCVGKVGEGGFVGGGVGGRRSLAASQSSSTNWQHVSIIVPNTSDKI